MGETYPAGPHVAVGQLSANANERHYRELDLMAVGIARNPGIFEIDPYALPSPSLRVMPSLTIAL